MKDKNMNDSRMQYSIRLKNWKLVVKMTNKVNGKSLTYPIRYAKLRLF